MDEQTLKIDTVPGSVVEIWKWSNEGKLELFDSFPHENNIGEIMLPTGNYVYYILSGFGEHKVK